jgi:hypothetical protein
MVSGQITLLKFKKEIVSRDEVIFAGFPKQIGTFYTSETPLHGACKATFRKR